MSTQVSTKNSKTPYVHTPRVASFKKHSTKPGRLVPVNSKADRAMRMLGLKGSATVKQLAPLKDYYQFKVYTANGVRRSAKF